MIHEINITQLMYRALIFAPSIKDLIGDKDRYNLCYVMSKFCFVNSLKINEAIIRKQNLYLILPEEQWDLFTKRDDLCLQVL